MKIVVNEDENIQKDNTPVIERYYRKWEAKKKLYADNNIVEIIPCPEYKPPKFSDKMLRTGKDDD